MNDNQNWFKKLFINEAKAAIESKGSGSVSVEEVIENLPKYNGEVRDDE